MADKIGKNDCVVRENRSISEITEFELNLPGGPLNTSSWIENIQISGVRFEFSNSKNLKKPQSVYSIEIVFSVFFLSKLCRK